MNYVVRIRYVLCKTTSRYERACTKIIGYWLIQTHVIIVLPAPINVGLAGKRWPLWLGHTALRGVW